MFLCLALNCKNVNVYSIKEEGSWVVMNDQCWIELKGSLPKDKEYFELWRDHENYIYYIFNKQNIN